MKKIVSCVLVVGLTVVLVTMAQEGKKQDKPPFAERAPDAKDKTTIGSGRAVRWEYKLVTNLSEADCNKVGEEGWELVGYSVNSDRPHTRFMAFKRPKR